MDELYHVLTRSIADYTIFNNDTEYSRMKDVIRFYQFVKQPISFSHLYQLSEKDTKALINDPTFISKDALVHILAYCLMPTHIHFVVRSVVDNGVSKFMSNVLNSYSRYFNLRHKRKGPLWQGRFKKIRIESEEQLLHVTRYIHLNPVTAYLVDKPDDWSASSYLEYIQGGVDDEKICKYDNYIEVKPDVYRRFVEERIVDQRELAQIKRFLLDDQLPTS